MIMPQSNPDKANKRPEETGVVVSICGDKTCKVQFNRLVRHELYGKYTRHKTSLIVHDPDNEVSIGDTVVVASCRPISKQKHWRLVRVVKKASLLQQKK